jgi:hypothetical protein
MRPGRFSIFSVVMCAPLNDVMISGKDNYKPKRRKSRSRQAA